MYTIILVLTIITSTGTATTSQQVGKYANAEACRTIADQLNIEKLRVTSTMGNWTYERLQTAQCVYIGK